VGPSCKCDVGCDLLCVSVVSSACFLLIPDLCS
jgi:hypothetical protein